MRLIPNRPRVLGIGVALLLVAGLGGSVATASQRAEPLEVPQGPGLAPEDAAGLPLIERVDRASASLRDRGYTELPLMAWALLGVASESGSTDLAERALELAPNTPGVRFEVARLLRSPSELQQSLSSLLRSYPAIVWLLTVGGAVLGAGALSAATLVIAIGFARTLSLHGHALGHLTTSHDPPSWPGVLIALAGLALIPLAGLGPACVVGAAGALTAMRLPRLGSVFVGMAVVVIGFVLGPGLDYWARFAALPDRDPAALAVWRADRSQPLPGDRALLERALERDPDDLLVRLGLARTLKQEGDVHGALDLVRYLPKSASLSLYAEATNLAGILYLADGRIEKAAASFEHARSMSESAAVLYNLSQAYARGMRLMERSAPFSAARDLDPELVSLYTSFEGTNVHRYLVQSQLPLASYLKRGLLPSTEAREIAREIRVWTLGPGAPAWAWLLLPGLAALGVAARRTSIERCSRCERPVCSRCAPEGATGSTCVRCARLFARGSRADPRVRKTQMERDRRRQRRMALGLASLTLVLPGAARVYEGRVLGGVVALLLAGTGAAFLLISAVTPVPFEVGELGVAIPKVGVWVLLAPAYLWALLDARRRLAVRKPRS